MAVFLASSGALALTALAPLPEEPTTNVSDVPFVDRYAYYDSMGSSEPSDWRVGASQNTSDAPPSLWANLSVVSAAFERLFRARGTDHGELLEQMTDVSPALILEASLSGYQTRGNADRLDLAIRIFGHMGRRCLPALLRIAHIGEPGQSAFVEIAAHADFLKPNEKLRLLRAFSQSPEFDTREKVLHITQFLDNETEVSLLKMISCDQDGDLAEEARSRLLEIEATL
jgi:hypothetical protein